MRSGRLVINGSGRRPTAAPDPNPDPNLVNVYRKMDEPEITAGDDGKISSVMVLEQLPPPPPKTYNVPVVDLSQIRGDDDKENAFRLVSFSTLVISFSFSIFSSLFFLFCYNLDVSSLKWWRLPSSFTVIFF